MLTIKQNQWAALCASAERAFRSRCVAYLREQYAAQTASAEDDALQRFVAIVVDEARRYGLETEQHILAFVDLIAALGFRMPKEPADALLLHVLKAADLDACAKVLWFSDFCSFSLRRQ